MTYAEAFATGNGQSKFRV
jgi:hypothetical protein